MLKYQCFLVFYVGINTKWYRYKNNLTQEQYGNKAKFKMPYISVIETDNANLICKIRSLHILIQYNFL